MRIRRVMILMIVAGMGLSGCHISGEVENQAYVLVLGADRLDGGALELTARVPQIAKSGEPQSEGGSSTYLAFSASGGSYAQALETLQWATPRQLNLSHIEMIVVSEALTRERAFPALIDDIVRTPHLYATAQLVVCEGAAREFIEAQDTVIGTRMSAELKAMLKHYAAEGYIPESSLAEVCYANESVYADPVSVHAFLDGASADTVEGSAAITNSPARQRFSGAALFKEGRLAGFLDLEETKLLSLVRGSARSIYVGSGGAGHELIVEGRVRKRATVHGEEIALALELTLSSADGLADGEADAMADGLRAGLESLLARCQRLGVDPFGFADVAAGRFATIPQWRAFNWRQRFASADIRVDVDVVGST